MNKILYPQSVDEKKYSDDHLGGLDVKYGLPRKVTFCTKCVISNQRPNSAVEYEHREDTKKATIVIDGGVCDACKAAEAKHKTDWALREKELVDLCNRYRSKNGSFDCIVSGSGGKDSFFQSHILKYKFGMHPLTVTWAPHIYTDWGWKNFQAWIHSGFDNYLYTPNGRVHRLLTRLAVDKLFHPFQAFMLGQKSYSPKMACLLNIPLIFYGENEAEYGNPTADMAAPTREWKYFTHGDQSKIYLSGVSLSDLREDFGLKECDLDPYMPADPQRVADSKVEVHYLGYYLKWHPQSCYYYAVENGGFQASPERTPGTYSKYNSIDDKIDDLHYYTTFIKFGIGRATYDAAQEIRSSDITREEGVALVKKFDGEYPSRFADELFRYLSVDEKEMPQASKMFEKPVMDKEYFARLADNFRSPHLWRKVGGEWKLRHTSWQQD